MQVTLRFSKSTTPINHLIFPKYGTNNSTLKR